MTSNRARKLVWWGVAAAAVLYIGSTLVLTFISLNASGAAALPNGAVARINGPFGCSERPGSTTIEAGGRRFDFTATEIAVDGLPVAVIDPTVTRSQIEASYWSARLQVNGHEVPITR